MVEVGWLAVCWIHSLKWKITLISSRASKLYHFLANMSDNVGHGAGIVHQMGFLIL